MKKGLNIKKISLFIIILVALFVINDKVKAEDLTCYYENGVVTNDNEKIGGENTYIFDYNNLNNTTKTKVYIKLSHTSSKNTFSLYDYDNKKNRNGYCTGTSCAYAGSYDVVIDSASGKQLKESDFSYGCPSQLQVISINGSLIVDKMHNYYTYDSDFSYDSDTCSKSDEGILCTNVSLVSDISSKSTKLNNQTDDDNNKNFCETAPNTLNYIKMAYNFVRFIVPVVIVVLSAIDFASVVLSGETDKMEKAKRKFVIRLLVGIIILFIPIILEMILKLAGILDSGENLIDIACLGD